MKFNVFEEHAKDVIYITIIAGMELTNFKWFVKKPRQKFRFHELFLPCFLAFPESKKIIKETAVLYNMHQSITVKNQ